MRSTMRSPKPSPAAAPRAAAVADDADARTPAPPRAMAAETPPTARRTFLRVGGCLSFNVISCREG